MTDELVDVLVVGAGPVGLTLALQAHDHGARVRVIERRSEPFRPSRALIVHPRTLEVLRPLGVTEALLAQGDVSPTAHLHLGRRVVQARLGELDLPDTAFPHLLLIRQADVERILSRALEARGVAVERGSEAIHVVSCDDHAQAAVRRPGGGNHIACRYLAGCDGPASVVRTSAGFPWPGGRYRHEVVLADLELQADLAPGVVHVVLGPQGLVFLFALGERATWRLLATRRAPDDLPFGQPGPAVAFEELQTLLDAAGLDASISDLAWSTRVPVQHRRAGGYRSNRLLIAGDAAHAHSPAGGQGMNLGIQDATNLGWKLAFAARSLRPAAESEALLDSYEIERRPVARQVLAMTHAIFWAESGTDSIASLTRWTAGRFGAPILPSLLRRRRLLAESVRTLSQLRVRYRYSPISLDGPVPGRSAPKPGTRLADQPTATVTGGCRLHTLLAGPGIHLLVPTGSDLGSALLGEHVHVHQLSGLGTEVVGVRPDGYVGFRSGTPDESGLLCWLDLVNATPIPLTDPGLAARQPGVLSRTRGIGRRFAR